MAKLAAEGVISRENLDQARAETDARAAAVRADQAAIESARAAIQANLAALENARVQLGYTTISSPIDGRTGNLIVKQGNLIKANDVRTRHHQPGHPHLRDFRRAGGATWRRQALHGPAQAGSDGGPAGG